MTSDLGQGCHTITLRVCLRFQSLLVVLILLVPDLQFLLCCILWEASSKGMFTEPCACGILITYFPACLFTIQLAIIWFI